MAKKIRMHVVDTDKHSVTLHPETSATQVQIEGTDLNLSDVIGDISELATENKNLVDAINENFTRVVNGKTQLEETLAAKGVTVVKEGSIITFEELVTAMDNLVYVPLIIDYYKYGDEQVDITGGWEVANLLIDLQNHDTYTIRKDPTYLYMDVRGMDNRNTVCGFKTANTFDVTGINKLYCELELIQNINYNEHYPIFYFRVRDENGNIAAYAVHEKDDITTLPKTIVMPIDVEKIKSCNLEVSILCPGTQFYRKEIKIKRIWGTS